MREGDNLQKMIVIRINDPCFRYNVANQNIMQSSCVKTYFKSLNNYGNVRKLGKYILWTIFTILAFAAILFGLIMFGVLQYHDEIYSWFSKGVSFIFGDSTENVVRNIVKQIIDNFLKNLFTDK